MTDPKNRNILALAYMGDAVYELYARRHIMAEIDAKTEELHRRTIKYVSAAGQAAAADRIKGLFNEEELSVFMRGRNHRSVSRPRNQDPRDYRKATGLEAVAGYLYLRGDTERLEYLMERIIAAIDEV